MTRFVVTGRDSTGADVAEEVTFDARTAHSVAEEWRDVDGLRVEVRPPVPDYVRRGTAVAS